MATQDTTATASEIVTGGQYPDYDNDAGEFCLFEYKYKYKYK